MLPLYIPFKHNAESNFLFILSGDVVYVTMNFIIPICLKKLTEVII